MSNYRHNHMISSLWIHKNGSVYRVDDIRNEDASEDRRDEYPIIVCYTRESDGSKWAKDLDGFLMHRRLLKWNQKLGVWENE